MNFALYDQDALNNSQEYFKTKENEILKLIFTFSI